MSSLQYYQESLLWRVRSSGAQASSLVSTPAQTHPQTNKHAGRCPNLQSFFKFCSVSVTGSLYRHCLTPRIYLFLLCVNIKIYFLFCSDQKPTETCPLSQEVKSETSSNPSSPEICPNKDRWGGQKKKLLTAVDFYSFFHVSHHTKIVLGINGCIFKWKFIDFSFSSQAVCQAEGLQQQSTKHLPFLIQHQQLQQHHGRDWGSGGTGTSEF